MDTQREELRNFRKMVRRTSTYVLLPMDGVVMQKIQTARTACLEDGGSALGELESCAARRSHTPETCRKSGCETVSQRGRKAPWITLHRNSSTQF